MDTKNKTAKEIYEETLGDKKIKEFEDLPPYEQHLWQQSARQVKKARKIFGDPSS